MTYAETIFFDVRPGQVPKVVSALAPRARTGLWVTEIGRLNRVTAFRAAEKLDVLMEGREDILASVPQDLLAGTDVTSWKMITPLMSPGVHGGVYEWRCYGVVPGHREKLEAAFLDAVPAREALSPLMCSMMSLEGSQRFAHLWPYGDLAERSEKRAAAVASGQWPPKVADFLTIMENEILTPLPGSAWR